MKNQPQNRIPNAQAGFTLLEIVVVIVVFGVLCAAAVVNWASFMRYQELREDAAAFHKELLALKAKALESNNTFTISYKNNNKEYEVTVTGTDDNDNTITDKLVKTGNFNNNVEFDPKPGTGNWNTTGIKIEPNLNAFGTKEGSVEITSKKVPNKRFRVFKGENSIKPELEYKSGSGQWKKI